MNKNNEIKMIDKNYELIKFEDGDFSLDVNVSPTEDTVWLTLEKMSSLFERDKSVISRHINNVLKDFELNKSSTVAFFATVQIEGDRMVERLIPHYNLDMILAVGYRVKSKRGIIFRRWSSNILKQYLLKGHVINESRCLAHSDNMILINNEIDKNDEVIEQKKKELKIEIVRKEEKLKEMEKIEEENQNIKIRMGFDAFATVVNFCKK